jgi:hypothetical protein
MYTLIEGKVRQMDLDSGEIRITGKWTGTQTAKARKGSPAYEQLRTAFVHEQAVVLVLAPDKLSIETVIKAITPGSGDDE